MSEHAETHYDAEKITLALEPRFRAGIKVSILNKVGRRLDSTAIYPYSPQNFWFESIAELAKLAIKYHVKFINITDNGIDSRETKRLVDDFIKMYPDLQLQNENSSRQSQNQGQERGNLRNSKDHGQKPKEKPPFNSAMADALAQLIK